jgi:hypothetical protein
MYTAFGDALSHSPLTKCEAFGKAHGVRGIDYNKLELQLMDIWKILITTKS